MSKLIIPGQQQAQQVAWNVILNGDTLVLQINGLTLPPLTAEAVKDLSNKLGLAADQAIANRIPLEPCLQLADNRKWMLDVIAAVLVCAGIAWFVGAWLTSG